MGHGVPWRVAHELDPTKRLAYVIYYGENFGDGVWNWESMAWEAPRQ